MNHQPPATTSNSSSNGRKVSDSHSETRQTKSSRNKLQAHTSTGMNFGGGGSSGASYVRKRKLDSSPPDSPSSASPDEDSSGGDGTSCTSLPVTPPKVSRHDSVAGTSLTGFQLGASDELPSTSAGSSLFFHHGLGDQQPPTASVNEPVTHRYVVHISDTGLLAQRARSATDFSVDGRVIPPNNGGTSAEVGGASRTLPGRRSSHQYRFECELGDVWTDMTGVDRISGMMTSLLDGVMTPRRSSRKSASGAHPSTDAAVIEGLEMRGYCITGQLTRGHFGTFVLQAHSSSHQRKVAVKVLPLQTHSTDIPKEVVIHEPLKHDNILALLSHHVIDSRYALVMELCENGSIHQLLSKTAGGLLTEPVCRRYFGHMNAAVTYLHSRRIVHRDIRTENFMLDSYDRAKLIDFSTAIYHAAGDRALTEKQGHPGYWPPEVLEMKAFNPRSADVWALGVTLFVMLTSRLPFGDTSGEKEALACMQRGVDLTKNGPVGSVRLSSPVCDLLRGLLHYVTEARFTLNRVRSSDWMNQRDGPSLKLKTSVTQGSNTSSEKPYIGNFYLVTNPQKFKDSPHEKFLKDVYDI